MNRRTFHISGFDEDGVQGAPEKRRLVCLIEGDGKVAIWGQETLMRNIEAVMESGAMSSFEAEWIEPPEEFKRKFGHRYWVPENADLKVLK